MIDSIELTGDYLLIPKIRRPLAARSICCSRVSERSDSCVRLGLSPNQLVTVTALGSNKKVPINRPTAHLYR